MTGYKDLPEEDRIVAEAIAGVAYLSIGKTLYEAGMISEDVVDKMREDVKKEVGSS